jgi:hypothetical protein
VFVAGYDGFVFAYEVNTTEGGECKKITEYLLFNMTVSSNDQQPITTNIERKTVGKFFYIHCLLAFVSFFVLHR